MKTCCDKHKTWSLLGTPPLARNADRCENFPVAGSERRSEELHDSESADLRGYGRGYEKTGSERFIAEFRAGFMAGSAVLSSKRQHRNRLVDNADQGIHSGLHQGN